MNVMSWNLAGEVTWAKNFGRAGELTRSKAHSPNELWLYVTMPYIRDWTGSGGDIVVRLAASNGDIFGGWTADDDAIYRVGVSGNSA